MCDGCYAEYLGEYGAVSVTPRMIELAARLRAFDDTPEGLHIVIDDWNIEDSHIIWCLSGDGGNAQGEAREIGMELLEMTLLERNEVLRMVWA